MITGNSGLQYDEQGFLIGKKIYDQTRHIDNNVEQIVRLLKGDVEVKLMRNGFAQKVQEYEQAKSYYTYAKAFGQSVSRNRVSLNTQVGKDDKAGRILAKTDVQDYQLKPKSEPKSDKQTDTTTSDNNNAEQNNGESGRFIGNGSDKKINWDNVKNIISNTLKSGQDTAQGLDPTVEAIREGGQILSPIKNMAVMMWKSATALWKLRKRAEPLPKEQTEANKQEVKQLDKAVKNAVGSGIFAKLLAFLPLLAFLMMGNKDSNEEIEEEQDKDNKGKGKGVWGFLSRIISTTVKTILPAIGLMILNGVNKFIRHKFFGTILKYFTPLGLIFLAKPFDDYLVNKFSEVIDFLLGWAKRIYEKVKPYIDKAIGYVQQGYEWAKDKAGDIYQGAVNIGQDIASWISGYASKLSQDGQVDKNRGGYLKQGLNIKGGLYGQATEGGLSHDGTWLLAQQMNSYLGRRIYQFTGFNDKYHKGTTSKHYKGLAFDFTLTNAAGGKATDDEGKRLAPQVKRELIQQLESLGLKHGQDFYIKDEYNEDSKRKTGGHIHVEFKSVNAAQMYYNTIIAKAKQSQIGVAQNNQMVSAIKNTAIKNVTPPKANIPMINATAPKANVASQGNVNTNRVIGVTIGSKSNNPEKRGIVQAVKQQHK